VARPWRWLLVLGIATCLAEATVFGAVAARRGVNADEGFYLLAGWRVLGGQRPYADFFFPQMPYLPYLEAVVLSVSGASLWAGRAINVGAASVLGALMALAGAQRSGRLAVGVLVAAAYAANGLLLTYLTVAKTYGVADLMLIAAFLLVAPPQRGVTRALAAGACAGIAIGTRLPSVAVFAVLLVWTAWGGVRTAVAFCLGAAVALLPCLWVASQDPRGFWFGNVEFHALRRELSGLVPILAQKATVGAKCVLLPQNLLLWILAAAGVSLRPRQSVLPGVCGLALAAGYLAATPTYLEYMVQVIPFLLLAGIPAFAVLLQRRALAALAAGLYAAGLLLARRDAPDDTLRGEKNHLWALDTVHRVSNFVRERSDPGDRILSWWEGYPFLAQREGFVGVGFWESNMAKKLAPDLRRRFHVLDHDEIRGLVEGREPRLIVVPAGTWMDLEEAMAQHYTRAARIGEIEVLELRDGTG
jgi:hypothetical protein